MFFKIPTLVYLEDECLAKRGELLADYGHKALIVTGKSSARNVSLADVTKQLEKHGISYEIYDQTKENPPVEQVMELQAAYRNKSIDFLIGLGGGSAIDLAKAVAVMLYYPQETANFLYKPIKVTRNLPVVAIPTTCGTGSEVTGASVITRHEVNNKQSITSRVYPALALLDGKYIKDCPQSIINNTSIDALGHLVESYINSTASEYSDMIVREGLRVWTRCKETLRGEHRTKEDLYNLMLSANYGGMAIAHCGTSLPHGASYTVTYNTGMPHGKAVGYFLYGYLKYADEERVRDILELTGFENLEQFRDFIMEVCQIEKLDDELLEKCAVLLAKNQSKLRFCPYDTSEETIRKVVFSL
ncbi:MAG: iron-containing alcohol dehydrogenase [Erysipelotrichaceae bacterium]|nr:iron-containing alcohol dehydrogenase [Erysipelotrichaceae bacterium]